MKHFAVILFALTATSIASADNFSCSGTEPFWSLETTGTTVTFSDIESTKPTKFKDVTIKDAAGTTSGVVQHYFGSTGLMTYLNAFIVDQEAMTGSTCSDGMSDTKYPYSVYLTVDKQVLTGCCKTAARPGKE